MPDCPQHVSGHKFTDNESIFELLRRFFFAVDGTQKTRVKFNNAKLNFTLGNPVQMLPWQAHLQIVNFSSHVNCYFCIYGYAKAALDMYICLIVFIIIYNT